MKSSSRGDAESSRSPPSRLRPRESSAENVGPAPRVARKEMLPRAGMKTIRSSSLSNNNNNNTITNTSCSIPTCAPSSSTTPGAMTSATSGTSTSSGWQYTSNSRCLSCGKLGCNNCSIRVDPEAKRRKLESLRMNTPYERAKLLRATEELQQEEGRRRHKLYIHFLSLHEAMMGQQLMERQLILIGMKEEHLRELIVCDERMRRRRMTELSDCHSLLAALTRHEIEGRHKLAVMEQADRDALHYERVGSSSLVEQLSREATIRHTLILHEGAAREALHRQRIEGGAIIAANEAARLACLDAFVESRDGLILDWREGLCRLQEVQHAHLTWIYHRIEAREELLRSYQHQQQQLLLLSSRVCEALKESMELAGEVVEQRRRKLHGALGELAGREVAERLAIAADMREAHHALHVWAKEEEEKVRRLEQRQEDDRGEELHTAMAMLLNISAEESDAFARIKEQELTERERRYQWMMSKEVARGEMMRLCLATVEGIREEEELRRRELCVELHRGEVEVVDQLHARDRRCRELAATEEVECAALRKAEHDARFRLVSAMAEHELHVRRWMTTKEAQVQELEQEEDGTRALLAKREETARDSIRWQRETEEEHALRHAKLQRSHIDEYHHACLDVLEVIQREEMEAMGELKRRWARDGLHALATAHTREQVEACREERTQRAWIMQVEASERATATSTVLMALQLMREEFAQLAQAHRFDVEAEEQSLRSVVLQTEATAMELLSRSCMASAKAAREAEAERFQAELRARQVCLEEDARLYNDLEELPECEATMARPTNSSRLGGGGELMAMKVQLLQDALGMPSLVEEDVQPAAVELLIALVDAVGQRRAAMKAEGCAAEKRATEADAKCARQERLLRGEKEKKEAHATRARREAEDRERRVQHDQEEKQRGEHQLVVERKRLKAIHDQLSAQQLTLDGLKKNIQKQYQR